MQFSNFTRVVEGNKIAFYTPVPLQHVLNLKYYKDDSVGNFSKKEFRWSFNSDYWSAWTTLNQGNISAVKVGGNQYIFLEIRYYASGGGKVQTFEIFYDGIGQIAQAGDRCQPLKKRLSDTSPCPPPLKDPVDARTLCGKEGDYYLWRPNHKGTQPISSVTNLQQVLNNLSGAVSSIDIHNALNVDGPGVGVYLHTENKTLYFKKLVEGNKIFISENIDGIVTISVDDSSINQLFTQIGELNGVNIGGGTGEIFAQRVGDEFQFRTIAPLHGGVQIQTVGDQIRIGLDASVVGESIWADPDPVSADVGGISSGDTFDGSTAINILEKMLYEYKPPEVNLYLNPAAGYYEKWNPATAPGEATIYGDFYNTPFAKVRITDVSSYVNGTGLAKTVYPEVQSGTFNFTDNPNSTWDDRSYVIRVYHKVNNIIMNPIDVSADLLFVEPYIWGIVDDTMTIGSPNLRNVIEGFLTAGQKLIVPKSDNEILYQRPSGMLKIKFLYAYPESYGELKNIFDVKNDFNVTESFDTKTLGIQIHAAPALSQYRVYLKNHWIDVQEFRLAFNI